jgi:CHAT domain-containing protein
LQGHIEEALPFFTKALPIAKRAGDLTLCGQIHSSIGTAYLKLNKPADALTQFEKALEYIKTSDFRSTKPHAFLGLGDAQLGLSKHEEAKESFESALVEGERISNVNAIWRAHSGLAWVAEKQGELSSAFEHYARSISIIESIRTKILDPELRSTFTESKLFVYERMINLLQRMKREPEALHYLERAKARVMLDMLQNKALSSSNKAENDLLAEERSLKSRIDLLSKQRNQRADDAKEQVARPTAEDAQERDFEKAELGRLQSEYKSVTDKIERINPELASLITVNPLEAGEIQNLLDPDTALLEYFLGTEAGLLFAVTSERVTAIHLGASSDMLSRMISDLREKITDRIELERFGGNDYRDTLSELYKILIEPVAPETSGKRHLVIVPHGVLHYLPFQTLISRGGKYLIESYTLSYLPSASILKYAKGKNRGNSADLFAAANPVTDLAPLPGAELEAREISAFYSRRLVLTGQEATKTSVKVESPNYDLLLFSTHGEMIESDPIRSNLRFTSSASDDGRLTVSEIFDMELKANLVTLSACETGLVKGPGGNYPKGDDLVGLSRAFMHAGIPSVLASLWGVSDDSTVVLMRCFFQNLKTLPKAQALRLAQLEVMKSKVVFSIPRGGRGITLSEGYKPGMTIDCSHPFFWAPFILVGDWK